MSLSARAVDAGAVRGRVRVRRTTGVAAAVRPGSPAAQDAALEHHPLLDPVVAVGDPAEDRLEVVRLDLGQEADLAEVDAEQRHVDLGDGASAARRNVPSPPSTTRTSVVGSSRRSASMSPAGAAHCSTPRTLAPAGGPLAQLDAPLRSSGCRRSRSARRHPVTSRPVDGLVDEVADLGAAGPGARWTRNSRLPSGPRIGEAMTARVPSPGRAASRRPARGPRVDRRIADDAMDRPAAAGLELRLDEGDDHVAARARASAATGPSTSAERDERHVDRDEADRLGERRGGQGPGVRPLHRDDPRIAAQRLGELAAPDVEGVDAARAALQQDVGEAAGRRADVEADAARRVDLERIERGGQLVAAAADVRLGADDRERRVGSTRSPGLRSCRAASPSPTRTLPASTSACARVRDSTRPRSTSSWSSRTRAVGRRRAHPAIVAQPAAPALTGVAGPGSMART